MFRDEALTDGIKRCIGLRLDLGGPALGLGTFAERDAGQCFFGGAAGRAEAHLVGSTEFEPFELGIKTIGDLPGLVAGGLDYEREAREFDYIERIGLPERTG